jgi:hypothetical protein
MVDAIATTVGVEVGVIVRVRVGVGVGVGVLDPVLPAVGDGMGIGAIPTDALRTGALPTRASRDALDCRMKWPLPAPRVKLLGGTPHQWLSHPPATQRESSRTVLGPEFASPAVQIDDAAPGEPDCTAGPTRFQPASRVIAAGTIGAAPPYVQDVGRTARMK